jgi:starch phosphorylase
MIAEYVEKFYHPAAAKWQYMTAESCARAKDFSNWKAEVKKAWSEFAVKDVIMEVRNGNGNVKMNPRQPQLKVGSQLYVKALVRLGRINPDEVSVQFYHGPVDTWQNIRNGEAVKMDYEHASEHEGEHWFIGSMPCTRTGQHGVAVRVLPRHADLVDPHGMGLILWESPS